jgi:hypothetical protein|tara:strand:- start:284 stop:535 length:252 start_codon:yes stop_codon:yes gene_type:complete
MAPRGGTRGGKDQFKWDDVKQDKDRECYLGHSLHASVGRWQKGKVRPASPSPLQPLRRHDHRIAACPAAASRTRLVATRARRT